jgi:hypothetical protein
MIKDTQESYAFRYKKFKVAPKIITGDLTPDGQVGSSCIITGGN